MLLHHAKKQGKLIALARLSNFLKLTQRKNLMETLAKSQFRFCSSTYMFCGRRTIFIISQWHERTLRIVYKNQNLSFNEIIKKDGYFTIHHRHIQTISMELFRVKSDQSREIINNIFEKCQIVSYNLLRSQTDF